MRPIRLARDLVPVNELRSNLAEWLAVIEEPGRAVVVTSRGKAAAVLVAPEELDFIEEQRELVIKVLRGLREVTSGALIENDDVWSEMDALLAAPAEP